MRRRAPVVIGVLAAVAALAYLLVYLYRWEWHRAIVAGVLFIAIEIGIGIAMVLERMRRLEAHLLARDAEADAHASTRATLRAAERAPSEPFAWLSESADRLSVFVPLLLGAGVVLSALAWVVERVARLTARPTLERGLALRLQPLTVPAGALLGGYEFDVGDLRPPATWSPSVRSRLSWRVAVIAVVAIVAAVVLGAGIDSLADATQNRPDAQVAGSAGRVVLTITNRQAPALDVASARSLWGACANQIGTSYRLTGVEAIGDGRVELRVRPAIGTYAERRLRGCLSDAVTDQVQASVLEVSPR